jgi:hypothetical protein
MIAHIYPSVLQAVSGRGYAGCLDGCFQGYRGEDMQDLRYELPRIPIPRTWVNKVALASIVGARTAWRGVIKAWRTTAASDASPTSGLL